MNAVQIVLIVLFLILAYQLCRLYGLLPIRELHAPGKIIQKQEQEEKKVWPINRTALLRSIKIRCMNPELLFEIREGTWGILLLQKGREEKECILTVCSENETGPLFFRAYERETGASAKRIALMYTQNAAQIANALKEAEEMLKADGMKIIAAFCEGGMKRTDGAKTVYRMYCGRAASASLTLTAEGTETPAWLSDAIRKLPYDYVSAERYARAVKSIPRSIQRMLKMPFLKKAAVRRLMRIAPEDALMYVPQLNDGLRMEAQSDELLEESLRILRETAEKNGSALYSASSKKCIETKAARRLAESFCAELGSNKLQMYPCLSSAYPDTDIPVLIFPPEGDETAVEYYQQIIKKTQF